MSDLQSYILQKDHILYPNGKQTKKLIGLNLPGSGEADVMGFGSMMPPSKSRERHGVSGIH